MKLRSFFLSTGRGNNFVNIFESFLMKNNMFSGRIFLIYLELLILKLQLVEQIYLQPKPLLANGFIASYQICIKSHYQQNIIAPTVLMPGVCQGVHMVIVRSVPL
jgi:hypothetical protein